MDNGGSMDTHSKESPERKHRKYSIDELINNAINNEVTSIQKDWDEVSKEIINHEELEEDINIVRSYIDILKDPARKGSDKIFRIISASGNLGQQIKVIKNKIRNLIPSKIQLLSHIFTRLTAKIRNLSSYLWQLISQAMNLKEWSLNGGVNLGGLFGFSGNVNLQLTFST
jgi:hypothetical protein